MKSLSSEPEAKGERFVFQLFVAGNESHSKAARDNLKELCESHFKDRYEIQIIDVFKSYNMALKNGIFLTPALIKVSPQPHKPYSAT
jgi:circadian clock protein KaiB